MVGRATVGHRPSGTTSRLTLSQWLSHPGCPKAGVFKSCFDFGFHDPVGCAAALVAKTSLFEAAKIQSIHVSPHETHLPREETC